MMKKFISRPRCIYSGLHLDDQDEKLKTSLEHVIPLSLGGSNQFTTRDVSSDANSKAGNRIDDAVASLLPFLMLRQKYKLVGNRKTIPNVKIKGEFIDIGARANLDIKSNGELDFRFIDEQRTEGKIFTISTTEERARFLLNGRLQSAKGRNLSLLTPYGQITDEEDIEVALELADRNEGKRFKGSIQINTLEYHFAVANLMVKIALGLGHKVLGPEWTFGPGGHLLRQNLYRRPTDRGLSNVSGSIHAESPDTLINVFHIIPDHHVMAIIPMGKTTLAVISLFGGETGVCIINLNYDSRRLFLGKKGQVSTLQSVFAIPLVHQGSRPLIGKTLAEVANSALERNILPESRAAAKVEKAEKMRLKYKPFA